MASLPNVGALGANDQRGSGNAPVPEAPRTRAPAKSALYHQVRRWAGFLLLNGVNLGLFVAVWEYAARAELLPTFFIPRPTEVAKSLVDFALSGQLWYHMRYSLVNLGVGFGLSALVGVPLGLAAGTFPRVHKIVRPYYLALYSTPRLAIWPLLVLWGGFTIKVKIILIFISAIMPILINTIGGVSTVDPVLVRVGRVLNATRLQLYTKIVLPFTVPFILTGLTQGLGRALVAMVVSEMLGSGQGLGYVIVAAVSDFDPARVFAVLFLLVVIALVMVNAMGQMSDRLAPWRKQIEI